MTGEGPPEGEPHVHLRLDPEFARYYGLPEELPFRVPPGMDPEEPSVVNPKLLAGGLEENRNHPAVVNDPALRSFLANWPAIESLDRFLSLGNYTFAARTARDLLRQNPDLPCALFAAGVAASREGDLEEAADALEGCLSACPGCQPAAEELATVLALSGSWDGATLLLDRLDSGSPEFGGSGLYRRVFENRSAADVAATRDLMTALTVASRQDDFDVLLRAVENATRGMSGNAEIHRRSALALRGRGERARARALAEKAVRLDPRSAAAHHTLALLAVETGDLMEAERAALKARSLDPAWTAPVLVLASALRADGRPGHAASILKQAGTDHPGDMNLRKLEALCLLEAGRPAEARDRLVEIARHDGFDPAAHYNLARAEEALHDPDAARAAYGAAIERAPGFAAAREALARLDFREGRHDEARAALEALVRDLPEMPHGYRGLGDLHLDTDPAKAAAYYEDALSRRPSFTCAGLLYLAGLKALLEKDYAEAARLFDRSVRADTRRHRAWCNLGVASFHEGRIEDAIFAMEEAADLAPAEAGYQDNLHVFYRTAFWRHPFRNFRFLSKARRVSRRSRELKRGAAARGAGQGPGTGQAPGAGVSG